MKKLVLFALSFAQVFANTKLLDEARIQSIAGWGKEGTLKLGEWFVLLQGHYISTAILILVIAVPSAFATHYMIIGPKIFSHDGEKIFAFSVFERVIHWIAALAWIILIPTGLVIIFGDFFGGGAFVRFARHLHGIGTLLFIPVVFPMFFVWVKKMLLVKADIKWLMMLGGYLQKKKQEVPAFEFNAGQKMWYWTSTLGGMFMIATGAQMYAIGYDLFGLGSLFGLSHIELLRLVAIAHNIFAFAVVALFFTHVYMAVFAIKGSIHSMITGYKEEDEVKHLHSLWYKRLKGLS